MRFRYVPIALAVLCAAGFGLVSAQEGHEGHGHDHGMDPATMMKMMAEMAKPAEQHAEMSYYVGTWKTQIKHFMGPEPTESAGTYSYEWALGNRYLVGTYEGAMMEMPFHGMSIDGFDKVKGEYFSIWMDTFGTGFMASTGKADGDQIVYNGTSTDPMSGGDIPHRMVTKRVDDDTFTFVMYMTQGGQEMKVMEMTANRVGNGT